MDNTRLPENITPAILRGMDTAHLRGLADAIRPALIAKLAHHGGHVGPNLGVVEATIALHYVFDTPKDKVVFDVSHETYIHKMLTGRTAAFTDPARYGEVSGYTSPHESPDYDLFEIGHTSTSISLATGLAKARDLRGDDENVIAFIGDASLGGGMALEGLDYAPELHSNFIVILNDNQMSIAENHGALYRHLKTLRDTNGTAGNNIFKALGYEYIYVQEGNDIDKLIEAFRKAKGSDHAVLVHINTVKGKGLPVAEAKKEMFHWSMPFNPESGDPAHADDSEGYDDIFVRVMLRNIKADKNVVMLTAGTPGMMGFVPPVREKAGQQYVDTGITEQDAVTMAAGLAKGGARPVMGVASPFIQRAYDQLSHDVAVNDLPAVFVIFASGLFGIRDVTHLGLFDIAMISNIPDIRFLSPAGAEEYEAMLQQSIDLPGHPVVIRTPGGMPKHYSWPIDTDFDRYQTVREGEHIAVIATGPMLDTALEAADILKKTGLALKVINARNLSTLDTATLDGLKDFRRLVTIEDGISDGGFGQKVAAYLSTAPVQVTVLGYEKKFIDRYDPKDILMQNGMTPQQVADLFA